MGLCLLLYPIYSWLEFFCQLLSFTNILLPLEFIYYGEKKKKKKTVLKKPPKSGLWLCKIILIFPGDEPLECIYLVEFPLFIDIYTHIYIYTLHFLYVFNIIVCFFSFGA